MSAAVERASLRCRKVALARDRYIIDDIPIDLMGVKNLRI